MCPYNDPSYLVFKDTSHVDLFNTLQTVCFMHGLSIYEIKRICRSA